MRISPLWFAGILTLCLLLVTGTGMYLRIDDFNRTPLPVPPACPEIFTLTFAGDIMAHDVNFHLRPHERIYRDVEHLLKDDLITFGNLEFPLDSSKPYQNYPLFNNHPEYVVAAIEAGFDAFSAANNHSADQGRDSILATRNSLNELSNEYGITWSGIRGNVNDPMVPVSINKAGMHIGFLAVTLFLNRQQGSELVYLVNYRNIERQETFFKYIESVRPAYDLLVLSVHGGVEYRDSPLPYKAEFFHRLSDAGADIVWGHHPHVLQPYEIYSRKDGSNGVIIYSAGNFISGQTWRMPPAEYQAEDPPRGETALFQVRLVKRSGGIPVICGVSALPLVNYRDPGFGMVVKGYEDVLSDAEVSADWRDFYLSRQAAFENVLTRIELRNQVP